MNGRASVSVRPVIPVKLKVCRKRKHEKDDE
jgi:hypothetical protein